MSKLKSPSLTRTERKALRSEFLMKTGLSDAPPSYFFNMLPRYAAVTAYSFLIAVVFVSPIAFSAEKSEPGDLLYPIKAVVNEPIKKAVKVVIPHKVERKQDEEDEEETEDRDKKSRKNNSSRNDDGDEDEDDEGDSDDEDDRDRDADDEDEDDQETSSTVKATGQTAADSSKSVVPSTTTVPLVPVVTKPATSSSASSSIPTPVPPEDTASSTTDEVEQTEEVSPEKATATEAEVTTEEAGAGGDNFKDVLKKAGDTVKDTVQKINLSI